MEFQYAALIELLNKKERSMKRLSFILTSAALISAIGCQQENRGAESDHARQLQPLPDKYLENRASSAEEPVNIELVDQINGRSDIPSPVGNTGISSRAIDPNYPGTTCLALQWDTLYSLTLPSAGTYCVEFPTSFWNPAKYEISATGLALGNNVDLELHQWEVSAGFFSRGFSANADQSDEQVVVLSDDGHFAALVVAPETDGTPFLFKGSIHRDPDANEMNDTAATATALTEFDYMIGNLDNVGDFDFYEYTIPNGANNIDVYAQLQSWHTLLLDIGDGSGWQVLDDTPTATEQYQKTYDVRNNSTGTVILAVLQEPGDSTVNALATYRLRVNDYNPITSLQNHSVSSYRLDTQQYVVQTIPDVFDDQTLQLMKGAHDQLRFIGRFWGSSKPASNKQFTFSFSMGTSTLFSDNFYYTLTTNDEGWFSITMPLTANANYKCWDKKYKLFDKVNQPERGFKYDVHRYSIISDNPFYTFDDEWIDSRQFFWLCSVNGSDNYDYDITY